MMKSLKDIKLDIIKSNPKKDTRTGYQQFK